jgi:hypothetical protein
MQRLSFFAALASVLGSVQTMACENAGCTIGDKLAAAECNIIGCVRSINGFEQLTKNAERHLSVMRAPEPANPIGLCAAGNCATEPAITRLPEHCGRAGCAMPQSKPRPPAGSTNGDASIPASIIVTDVFASLAYRPVRLPSALPWATWAERWGLGGLYKPPAMD